MNGLLLQLAVSLRLHFRNRMAVIYSYLFPTIFLLAFWVLYRYETPPLVRHMGELLTVTILGGACFGLPTTFVSDRERGVWRRYRLTPVPTSGIVASTVAARYLLLLIAGLIQLALAMLIGMPFPRHPFDLFVAFSCVSFAFIGLGLVIATMADNVPAVQALGQCIFLPMLIIGGVAVPLESLPEWAQHVSAFFPGRYAVEALRACVMGTGLGDARFSVLALLLIGAAGCVTGARLFRWDSQQRFTAIAGKGWVVVALLAWAAVGIAAETRHRTLVRTTVAATPAPAPATPQMPAPPQNPPTASASAPADAARHSPNSAGWRADWGFLRCAGTVNASGSPTRVRACTSTYVHANGTTNSGRGPVAVSESAVTGRGAAQPARPIRTAGGRQRETRQSELVIGLAEDLARRHRQGD